MTISAILEFVEGALDALKSQWGMHLATQDAHLLNFFKYSVSVPWT